MFDALALYKLYKDNKDKQNEQFSNQYGNTNQNNTPPRNTNNTSLLGGIILLCIYIYVFKSAWECFTSIPPLPRIIICIFCCSFWFIYLVFRYFSVLKCSMPTAV